MAIARTAEQQTVVSVRNGRPTTLTTLSATLSAGGRTFTWKHVPRPLWPGIAGTISRDRPGEPAHMLPRGQANEMEEPWAWFNQLLDEMGTPVLYTGGVTSGQSGGYIKFPGRRWLRFPVRGTMRANAIMTAVDQAGDKVARYRLVSGGGRVWKTVEITVHPGQELTDELALAMALSAPWLHSRFDSQ